MRVASPEKAGLNPFIQGRCSWAGAMILLLSARSHSHVAVLPGAIHVHVSSSFYHPIRITPNHMSSIWIDHGGGALFFRSLFVLKASLQFRDHLQTEQVDVCALSIGSGETPGTIPCLRSVTSFQKSEIRVDGMPAIVA